MPDSARATAAGAAYNRGVSYLRASFLGLLLLSFAGCSEAPEPQRPDVILITVDTTRADRFFGTERSATLAPQLADFAAECRVFSNARSVGSLTLPAHASMLTGLYPPRHGARANGPQVLTPAAETLAEHAARAGYQTAAFVGSLALDRAYGVAQGFEVWSQPNRAEDRVRGQISERSGSAVANAAKQWMDARSPAEQRPLFAWLHFFDPHAPYAPPQRYLDQAGGDPYDGEIAALDAAIGSVLADLRARGVLDDAVVMIVGDHGESLGEHGEATHGLFVYDSTLRVPFLLRDPSGDRAGSTDARLVSVVDVQPTLMEAMGLDVDSGVDGVSLYRRPVPEGRALYAESLEGWRLYGWSPLFAWIDARGKYVHSSVPEFFALSADRGETQDLYTDEFDNADYRRALRALAARPRLDAAPAASLDAQDRDELAALGYTASAHESVSFPQPGDELDGPSPASSIAEAQAVEDALAYFVRGRVDEAAQRFEGLLAANPQNRTAADRLIEIRVSQERWDLALPLLEARAELPPETIALHRDLARCLTALGREDEAQGHLRRMLELHIAHHERRGEQEEAARYRRILADAPR